MITIKAKIDIGENGTFDNASSGITPDEEIINVSSSFTDILGQKKSNTVKGFTLGESRLGGGDVYVNKLPYFVSRTLSDNWGNFTNAYSITLRTTQKVNAVAVVFDETNNLHPNSIKATTGKRVDWTILGQLSSNGTTAYLKAYTESKVQIGAEVMWHNEFATVTDLNGEYYTLQCKANGEFVNYIGFTITTFIVNIVYDDDARIEINLAEPVNIISLYIDNWNKPISPFILTGLYAIGDFEITSDNLVSFNSDIVDRSNVEYPNYGLISNTSNLTFIDFDRTALELITKKILTADKLTTVWVENTTENKKDQVCQMSIQTLTYNNDNLQVNMQLKDNLETMQDITVAGLYVDPTNPQSQTAKWYYDYLYQKTVNAGFDILSFDELDSDTQNVLTNTTIEYPLLESDTLWNEWTKICQLCLCHMYVDNNNRVVLKYSNGN